MRVLTKYEQDQFDIAFKHILSLSAMQNESTELYMLRHGNNGETPIPKAYHELSESLGGFNKVKDLFCYLYREQAIKWLIKYCFQNAIQPSSFEIIGSVRKINISHQYIHQEIKYSSA